MKEFYRLNKSKLLFLFWGSTGIFSLFATIPFFVGAIHTVVESLLVIVAVFLFCCFLVTIAFLSEWNLFNQKQKVFSKAIFSTFFNEYKFNPILINTDTKWQATHQAMQGEVNGFAVVANIGPAHITKISFCYKVARKEVNKKQFKHLSKTLKKLNAELGFDGILLLKKPNAIKSAPQLMADLTAFSEVLHKEGFTPLT